MSIFKRDRKLSAWAGEDWIDTQTGVARRKDYAPFPTGNDISGASCVSRLESTART